MASISDGVPAAVDLYSQLDAHAQDQLKKFKPTCGTCTKAYCCELLALCGPMEAAHLALKVLRKPDWRAILPKLAHNARAVDYDGVDEQNFAEKHEPCPFLSTDRRCTVYADRPGACRYLYSLDDPELCDATKKATRRAPDFSKLENGIGTASIEFAKHIQTEWMVAPISVQVLFFMHDVVMDKESPFSDLDRDFFESETRGVKTPAAWMMAHFGHLVELAKIREADPNYRQVVEVAD